MTRGETHESGVEWSVLLREIETVAALPPSTTSAKRRNIHLGRLMVNAAEKEGEDKSLKGQVHSCCSQRWQHSFKRGCKFICMQIYFHILIEDAKWQLAPNEGANNPSNPRGRRCVKMKEGDVVRVNLFIRAERGRSLSPYSIELGIQTEGGWRTRREMPIVALQQKTGLSLHSDLR